MSVLERKLPSLKEARLNWDIVATGDMVTAGAEVIADVEGAAFASVHVKGVFSLTFITEVTRDEVNWFQVPMYSNGQLGAPVAQFSGTATQMFHVRVAGFTKVRVRSTTFTSGIADVTIATVMSALSPVGVQAPEPLPLLVRPAVSAANTALTLTVPSAGAGLFHIIHQIKIWALNQSANAIAASAGFDITTTNLGGIQWRNINDIPAWTRKPLVDMDIENGLRSTSATATSTIIIPALGAGVSAEALVLYKVGA